MLQSFLFKIRDNRRKQGRRYELVHILLFAIFAILSGANSYRKIHCFINSNYEILDTNFSLNWGKTPSYTTIRNIIKGVSSTELEESFREYSNSLVDNQTDKKIVTFDGKTLKGSFDRFNDKKAIQILSAFTDKHIILAHEEIDTKTNEIPTTQELIVKLGLSNCVFTLDAIHCQEETLEVANKTGNDVIVQVKKNQKTLFNDCQKTAETTIIADEYTEPTTKERNRIESRNVQVFANNLLITHTDKWQLVKAIIKVYRKREVFNAKTKLWKESNETSFYISTTYLDAKTFCQSIRNHWGIENKNHYVKDVTMLEDKSRIRINPNIFAKLRSFALNIIRANNVENVNLELYNNCMKLNKVLNYFGVKEN